MVYRRSDGLIAIISSKFSLQLLLHSSNNQHIFETRTKDLLIESKQCLLTFPTSADTCHPLLAHVAPIPSLGNTMPVSHYHGTWVYLKLHQFRINIAAADHPVSSMPVKGCRRTVRRVDVPTPQQNTAALSRGSGPDVITLLFGSFCECHSATSPANYRRTVFEFRTKGDV